MTAKICEHAQKTCIDIINDNPNHLKTDWARLKRHNNQRSLNEWIDTEYKRKPIICLDMPKNINWNKMKELYDFQPRNYEELISLRGVGPNTIRALALISELIYGDELSWQDPIKFSFTVGGKDGVPFPVDRVAMDKSIEIIQTSINNSRITDRDKIHSIKRLKDYLSTWCKNYSLENLT
jgi:hypothetical protein